MDFPLTSHQLMPASSHREQAIESAMKILEATENQYFKFTREYCKAIHWVELKSDFIGKDDRITSASFPKCPGAVFISNKAMFHIPPNSLFEEPSFYALAENLFHEAIHQSVNEEVLKGHILTNEFDSRTSPKIHIQWRNNQTSRNQFWELDRAFHAACVYSGLIRLRQKFLKQNLERDEKGIFEESLPHANESFNYLLSQLRKEEHARFFQARGQNIIKNLEERPYV